MTLKLTDYKINETFDGYLLIKNVTRGITATGSVYLTLFLADDSDTTNTKMWDVTESDIEAYCVGKIVDISAIVIEYQGSKQLKTQKIKIADDKLKLKPENFMKNAPIQPDIMRFEIDTTVQKFTNQKLKLITQTLLAKYDKDLYLYPAAASIHHAFIGGLAYHTYSMLNVAKALSTIYHDINKDLLYAGVILHDIAKIHEFESAYDTTRTLEGNLLGHIPMMMAELQTTARDLDIPDNTEELIVLQHMILSHHGIPEWGSSRTPIIREAQLLHMIDNIDAKMDTLSEALNKTEPGQYTERMFAMDNQAFYKPKF